MSELVLGKNVKIGDIKTYGKIIIGDNTIIEDNVVIGHPTNEMYEKYKDERFNDDFIDSPNMITIIGHDCIIKSGTIIYTGVKIKNNILCGHNNLIGEYSIIGDNSKIFDGSRIYAHVKIGKYARINGFCCDRSIIEDNASMFGDLVHKYSIPKVWNDNDLQ